MKIKINKTNTMKKILSLMVTIALFASCNQSGQKAESTQEINVAAVKTIELHVTGMTCEGCENTVMEAVNGLEGVTASKASHLDELTSVSFDTTLVSIEKISETINELGYTVVDGEI
jgi:copper chaperone CopZ